VSESAYTIRAVRSAQEVSPADWNRLATSDVTSTKQHSPFLSHAFFLALEESESATVRTGWLPQHIIVEDAEKQIVGLMPAYLKNHSRGEYVFDHGWAEAYENAGGRYYPKLQACVPFTPATGPRLLVGASPHAGAIRALLAQGGRAITERLGASSLHVTFCTAEEQATLVEEGYLARTDTQFHWKNEGYGSFEDFLSALSSRKRKTIRREREEALANGITIHRLSGADLTEEIWDAFFAFYIDTGSRKWGRPYLTRKFFSLIGQTLSDQIVLVMAKREGRWIAGAINFVGEDVLYGRHWGAVEHHPFLHFEVCYYQAIEHAIVNQLQVVEAGAQGEHKLARGYGPVTTYSAHAIIDPGFRRAVADYLVRERAHVAELGRELLAFTPFRRGPVPTE
jgi:predicted N-acyltransferase